MSWLPPEFAVGTELVALPVSARESLCTASNCPHIAARLAAKPGAGAVPVTIGAITATRAPGTFRLIYLVASTIMNGTTQDDQLAALAKAAARLEPC